MSMEAKAEARYIRVSAQKARLVVDLIRGKKAEAAVIVLRAANKRIAPTVEKVLQSAIANAQNVDENINVDNLYVTEAYVNEGPRHEADAAGSDGPCLPLSTPHVHILWSK